MYMRKLRWVPVFRMRPLCFFFRKNWYGRRWAQPGPDYGENLYLIDIGAITVGVGHYY
jgi:hypothetical protein